MARLPRLNNQKFGFRSDKALPCRFLGLVLNYIVVILGCTRQCLEPTECIFVAL